MPESTASCMRSPKPATATRPMPPGTPPPCCPACRDSNPAMSCSGGTHGTGPRRTSALHRRNPALPTSGRFTGRGLSSSAARQALHRPKQQRNITEKDRNNYLLKYKISLDKIDYIHNWLEYTDVRRDYLLDSKKLITVGRFCYEKGYDYLLKVAKDVLEKYPDWEWDIYGTGDEKIKHELMQFNSGREQGKINLMGNVKGIENIYPGHGIYIMTSRSEGLPLVLLEAKIFGLPIVSFDCPTGPSEIVLDDVNGYLIDNYNIDIMSEKIQKLINNKELRLKFSRNSMVGTEKFNKEKILQQWISLIEEMIGGE